MCQPFLNVASRLLSSPWCLQHWKYDRAVQAHVKMDFGPSHLLLSLFHLSQKGPSCLLLHPCERNTWMAPQILLLERNGNYIGRAHTKRSLHVSRNSTGIREKWHIHCSGNTDTSWNVHSPICSCHSHLSLGRHLLYFFQTWNLQDQPAPGTHQNPCSTRQVTCHSNMLETWWHSSNTPPRPREDIFMVKILTWNSITYSGEIDSRLSETYWVWILYILFFF